MNIQGLIERYEKFKASKKKMTSVDLVLKDLRTLDEPEPLPFKLKDVVRRIRGFVPTTQTRWLNDILKELGDDYGSMKYREGYEQGKFEGAWVGGQLKDADKIRQELNKPVIPQFVADWIEVAKPVYSLSGGMTYGGPGVNKWLENEDNQRTFALAWFDGYEVEEEKRYFVKLKAVDQYLVSVKDEDFLGFLQSRLRSKFTRKELEDANLGWVFDCPGIEIEEVDLCH
ncbi:MULTISPECIES: DUF1642 domain-containing protein [Streptococcus]|uniref:DUF1642 domain-containing protein n=1 Tax=Streptococcus TaxID=1301 RepID=UPI000F5D8E70|nr:MULTISPECIES: DUF1642 domain-containing protein [Streptococcus]RRD33098.1 DUF1642 domain-containing protein [Streptococcus sp. OH4692_COT-348]